MVIFVNIVEICYIVGKWKAFKLNNISYWYEINVHFLKGCIQYIMNI